jgi:hypothetical protein
MKDQDLKELEKIIYNIDNDKINENERLKMLVNIEIANQLNLIFQELRGIREALHRL